MQSIPKPRLLLVDDDPANLEILEISLEDLDVGFILATSGEEALARLEENEVALVMMDVQMPGMDGIETLRCMRRVPEWSLIPVILITAVHKEEDIMIEGIETGAVDFLPKPFDHRVLQGKVRILVDLYRERRRLEMEIQRRRAVEGELLAAKESAEKANRAKSEFLANMSHDIRTPMNAILGMADVLRETPLNSEQKKYINIFQSAGRNLLGLINDILDLSKIEQGRITYEKTPFNLVDLVENASEMFALAAHEKGLELVVCIHPAVPRFVLGDPGKLRQVLSNMIGNAVKFTRNGEVVIQVERVPSVIKIADSDRVELGFSVLDTGIGISAENLERIFSGFEQGDSSTTREYGGTGLGLTISKRLVEGMGGRISVDSEPGVGSSFRFRCSFNLDRERRAVDRDELRLHGLKVLLLSENRATCHMLVDAISARGGNVDIFDPEENPLVRIHSSRPVDAPLVVFIDEKLPEMAGLDLLHQLRVHPVERTTLIVLLSTDHSHQKIESLRQLGVDHHIIKPVKWVDLQRSFRSIMGLEPVKEEETRKRERKVDAAERRARKILLVDDSEDNRLLIQVFLKKTDHQLVTAVNGRDGIEKFKTGDFDLVLMDIHMPIMDGLAATAEIRKWEAEQGWRSARIIALTANAMEDDEKATLAAGCDYHLTKPISKARLLETIEGNSA